VRWLPSSGGVRVAVHDLGGDGPPLVLAHATGFCGPVLAPLAAHLGAAFRCWAFDARGHGDTEAPADVDWAWARFADDVLAVVEGLGLDPPYGFGHSAGGAALLDAEARRPGTFRALWCYEPIVWPRRTPELEASRQPLISGALRRRAVFASRQEAFANFAAKPPLSSLAPEALRAYVDCGFADPGAGPGVVLKCRPEVEAEVYRQGLAHDGFTRLGLVACPVVLARGSQSVAVEREVAEAQAAALPAGRLEELAGLGHFGPLEDPPRVAAAVAGDLRRSG
jgi:pimeloyl-ACP methyl ester carboxylesterase